MRRFLQRHGRAEDWVELSSPESASFDDRCEIDLGAVEPLITMPSSPGNVVPVREVAGAPVGQAYLASAGNPGYRGYAVPAAVLRDRSVHGDVAVDVNPLSQRIEAALAREGWLDALLRAGATVHGAGCDEFHRGTQAPPPGVLSLRTVNRNFPGRSGTKGDRVALVSAETARRVCAARRRDRPPRARP